jgi:hypothetical protein
MSRRRLSSLFDHDPKFVKEPLQAFSGRRRVMCSDLKGRLNPVDIAAKKAVVDSVQIVSMP